MILLQNPNIPTSVNPVEIDSAIIDIKTELEVLPWLTHGFGRAFKNLDITNGERVYFPEIYLGKQNGSYRYTNISPDNDKQGQCFFYVRRETISEYQTGMYSFLNYDVAVIFSVNMELINATLTETDVFQQVLIAQVRDVLTRQILGKSYVLKVNSVEFLFEDVFREFNLTEQSTMEKSPLSHFRFNISVKMPETCPVPEIVLIPLPSIVDMSLWLRGDVGVNGGSVSDGQPVSIWSDQSGNGNDFTQSIFVNQPTFLESGTNGQSGISFTSPNFLRLLNADLFVLNEGVIFVVCKRNAPSTGNGIGSILYLNLVSHVVPATTYFSYNAVDNFPPFPTNSYFVNMQIGSLDIDYGIIGTDTTLLSYKKTNTDSTGKRDGVTVGTGTGSQSFNFNGYHSIGQWFTATRTFEGEIYEIIIYENLISDSEITTVENYLKNKYGIT